MSKPVNIGQDLLAVLGDTLVCVVQAVIFVLWVTRLHLKHVKALGFNEVVFAFSKHWHIVFLNYWWIFVLLYELQVYCVGLVCW